MRAHPRTVGLASGGVADWTHSRNPAQKAMGVKVRIGQCDTEGVQGDRMTRAHMGGELFGGGGGPCVPCRICVHSAIPEP